MTKLVSVRVARLREKFRQFEHGGQCFGSDEIASIVAELRAIGVEAAALEDRVAAASRRSQQIPAFPVPPRPPMPPRPQPGAVQLGSVPLGRIVFVPHEAGA
ncbi:MAG: hypothetical protein KF810_02740 [Rhizobiaceae bacterium]|nr:hypothetical protein [Rhizobiaceae bacterium]